MPTQGLPARTLQFAGTTAAEARVWQTQARHHLAQTMLGNPQLPCCALDVHAEKIEHRAHYQLFKLTYQSRPDRTNYALVAKPHTDGKKPAVLALHGHESAWGQADVAAFDPEHIDGFCGYFAARGFVVVFPAVLDHTLGTVHRPLIGNWVWDALRCVDYLTAQRDVDTKRIGCVGLSTGGALALYTAALDERIAAVVSAGWFTTFNHIVSDLKVPPHCDCGQMGIAGLRGYLDICDIAALIAPRPLMLMHGWEDVTFCPGADPAKIDPQWQIRVMDPDEFDAALAETRRVYAACGHADRLRMHVHPDGHKVDNRAAFEWVTAQVTG